ncbi:trophoblast glycoprotein isoform X2 [Rhinoraja longicauda]
MPGCSPVQSLCRPEGSRVCVPSRPTPPLPLSLPLLLLLLLLQLQLHGSAASSSSSSMSSNPCPMLCECSEPPTKVKCVSRELSSIPSDIPAAVERLFITGSGISSLGAGSFGRRLEHLLSLNLSGNKIDSIESLAFASMPSLRQLDLSNNPISTLHPEAFGNSHSLRELNLSRALHNDSMAEQVSDLLQNGSLDNLVHLDMSHNDLLYMPARAFSRLTSLRQLQLGNNSFVSFRDTFQDLNLQLLDLRSNALKTVSNGTLVELSGQPQLRVDLRNNPFVCDCGLKDFWAWLQITDKVVEKRSLLCSSPGSLGNKSILLARYSDLQCSYQGGMESVLQTSYVFLGLVLALIGVIFMFVLYLNRKGIKKWLNNFRDACRDHMEGYHYRDSCWKI